MNRRLQQIVSDLSQNPQSTIPRASGTWARTKGAYRFFDHAGVTPGVILAGHQAATLERSASHRVVLLVQDTASLNNACQAATAGLGSLGNREDQALGLWLHTTLAVDKAGPALGLMQAQMWTRDPAKAGIAAQRKKRTLAEQTRRGQPPSDLGVAFWRGGDIQEKIRPQVVDRGSPTKWESVLLKPSVGAY